MTHLTLTRPRDGGAVPALKTLLDRVREERRIRRDIARLESMSGHLLRDIGLTRSNIRSAARHGLTRN